MKTLLMLLPALLLACWSSAAPVAPAPPQVLAARVGSSLRVRVVARALTHSEQDIQHATCPILTPANRDTCYWISDGTDDDKQWLLSGPKDVIFTIDLKTRAVDYNEWTGVQLDSHRRARFMLDPVDLEGLALPAESRRYARMADADAEILRAVAQEGARRAAPQ